MPTETCIKDKNINKNYNWDYYTKLKYVGEIRGRIGFRGYNVEDTVDEGTDGAAIVLGGTNIMKDGTINYEKLTYLSEKKYLESPEIMLKGGEILITKVGAGTGENALYEYYQERVTINPNVMLFIASDKVYPKYINYVLLNDDIKKEIAIEATKSGAQPAINQNYIENMKLILPNKIEQQAIADFLDEKCEKIDKVIGEIEEQIQVLEDYKKSLITETVTKGLDKNVPMKDSGIDYLGKISAHYKVTKLKYLLSGITDGTHGTFDRFAEGEYLLSAKNVFEDGLHIEDNESLISERDYREIIKNGFPQKGDVLVCCVGTIGRTCVYSLDKPLAFQRSVVFLRPNKKVKSKYLKYLMQAESSQIQMQLFANASAQAGIYMGTLQTIIVIEVPIAEQEQIADYLDKECEKIDKTISDKKEQLETIKEYKKSLIYEYVTGKKRVAC